MKIVLSPDAQAKAQQIPDFAERLERFINAEYLSERWRRQQLNAIQTTVSANPGVGLMYQAGHWVATGELPADFDLDRFIEEQRKKRIDQVAGL